MCWMLNLSTHNFDVWREEEYFPYLISLVRRERKDKRARRRAQRVRLTRSVARRRRCEIRTSATQHAAAHLVCGKMERVRENRVTL